MATQVLPRLEDLTYQQAAEHAVSNVPSVSPSDTAADVKRLLMAQRFDSVSHVAVIDGKSLVGIVRTEDLLPAPDETSVSSLMDSDPPRVAQGVDQEAAAWRAVQRAESGLAVVDEKDQFLGLIPPHRLLEILLWEHDEDLARLGGFMRDVATARTASQEPVPRRFIHRLPWLLVGLLGALFAAEFVGAFEGELEETVALAFFMPGIVYLADAVGTQTEALIIRGLSVGVAIQEVVWREAVTGLLVGLTLAAVYFPIGVWRWGDSDVALTVSLSLLAATSVATLVAMALPWAIQRIGLDPAFGSGPLATVIQDLLSILIFFTIASVVVA
jgi:magnesium transporter